MHVINSFFRVISLRHYSYLDVMGLIVMGWAAATIGILSAVLLGAVFIIASGILSTHYHGEI